MVFKYYQHLLDISMPILNPLEEDRKAKYQYHSMILSLADINILYDFFKDYTDLFTTS